jgi:antitoxin VapB
MVETVTAKVFMNGRSQAIQLPKKFRVETQEVTLVKEEVIVSPKKTSWKEFFETFEGDPNFTVEHDTALPQERGFYQ